MTCVVRLCLILNSPLITTYLFDSRKYLVPTAIYRQEDDVYCVWDGSHTIQELIRKGWKNIPLWYTSIEQIDETEMKQSVDPQATLAGESMICINKTINSRSIGKNHIFILRYSSKSN